MRPHPRLLLAFLALLAGAGFLLTAMSRGVSPPFIENALVLRSLAALYDPEDLRSAAVAWDRGWRQLCGPATSGQTFIPIDPEARQRRFLSAMRIGDFSTVRDLAEAGVAPPGGPEPSAYLAALAGNWLEATRTFVPTLSQPLHPFWGAVLYRAGQDAFDSGDTPMADGLLRQAEALNGNDGPLVSPQLARCLERWGRLDEARREWRRAAAVLPPAAPDWREVQAMFLLAAEPSYAAEWLAESDVNPMHAVRAPIAPDWQLVGFDLDFEQIRESPLLQVWLYWQTPRRPGQVARQESIVRNLVTDGAFSWDYAAPSTRPLGFSEYLYAEPAPVSVRQDGSQQGVLCVPRPPSLFGNGLAGRSFALAWTDGATLVQGGQVISRDGSGFAIGRSWTGTAEANPYSYLANGFTSPAEWTLFVGTTRLPAGAETVRVLLQDNYGPPGAETCFADLFLFELGNPPPV